MVCVLMRPHQNDADYRINPINASFETKCEGGKTENTESKSQCAFDPHRSPVLQPLPDAEPCRHSLANQGAQPLCSADHQAPSAPE